MKLDHSLNPYTKMNSEWIKNLNVRKDSIRILEENIGSNLSDIGHCIFFQDISAKAKETRENEFCGPHQDQKLLQSKGNSQQNKEATHGMGEDIRK